MFAPQIYELCVSCINFVWILLLVIGNIKSYRAVRKFQARMRYTDISDSQCSLIIPCYMPNEKDIIENTAMQFSQIDKIFNIFIVYNGRDEDTDLVVEKISKISKCTAVYCETSTSRAENIAFIVDNYASSLYSDVAIVDADNLPTPHCMQTLQSKLRMEGCAGVQGLVFVRGKGWLASMTSGFAWYWGFAILPLFEWLCGSSFYSGSCSMWKLDVLKEFDFKKRYSDDIDISWRLICNGYKICTIPLAQMHELAPTDSKAFLKQRIRWVVGFEQSAHEHFITICRKRPRALLILMYHYVAYSLSILNLGQLVLIAIFAHEYEYLALEAIVGIVCNIVVTILLCASILLNVHALQIYRIRGQACSCLVGLMSTPIIVSLHTCLFFYALYCLYLQKTASIQNATKRASNEIGRSHDLAPSK